MKTFLTVSAFALVLASSCQNAEMNKRYADVQQAPASAASDKNYETPAADSTALSASPAPENAFDQKQQLPQKPAGTAPAPVRPDWNKKIIKNANLELEVKDFKIFERQVNGIAGKYGGYIAEENLETSEFKMQSKVSIRVPAELFEQALTDLSSDADKIITKNITSKDVTGEIVDVRSRLEARRQARLRYLELMKDAKNMEEVFQVQKEVDEIQEEMEAAAARVSSLGHAAAYSTIQLTYFQVLNVEKLKDQDREPSFGDKILTAFGSGFRWLGDVLIVLVTLWPLLLGAAVLSYVVRKLIKKNNEKAAAVISAAAANATVHNVAEQPKV